MDCLRGIWNGTTYSRGARGSASDSPGKGAFFVFCGVVRGVGRTNQTWAQGCYYVQLVYLCIFFRCFWRWDAAGILTPSCGTLPLLEHHEPHKSRRHPKTPTPSSGKDSRKQNLEHRDPSFTFFRECFNSFIYLFFLWALRRRLFYHAPPFAILDEATSAINPDEEHLLYEHVIAQGTTVVSIAHRLELRRFHKRELRVKGDGSGGWELHGQSGPVGREKWTLINSSDALSMEDAADVPR